jgi:hypothetical protein
VIGVTVGDEDGVDLLRGDADPLQSPADVLEKVAVSRVDKDPLRPVDEKAVAVVFAGALPEKPVEPVNNFHCCFPFFSPACQEARPHRIAL